MKKTKTLLEAFSLGCFLILIGGSAYALPVAGITNGLGSVRVTATTVDFYSFAGGACGSGPNLGTPGCFRVTTPSTGDFPASGSLATIKDLDTSAGYPFVGLVGAAGLSQVVWSNGVTFDLTFLPAGGQPNCATLTTAQRQAANSTCTFYGGSTAGIFTLANNNPIGGGNATSVGISMNWLGNAYITSNASSTPYQGAFTTQLTPGNIDSVFNTISAPGGFIESAYSVTFAGTVPEPMSYALVGGGLLLLGFLGQRRKNN